MTPNPSLQRTPQSGAAEGRGMTKSDHPRVIVPPPLLYGGGILAVLAMQWAWPAPISGHIIIAWIGAVLIGIGFALDVWGAFGMIKARTPINPYRSPRAIVDAGAFRVSRNPLYVGLDLIFLGVALVLNSLWGPSMLVLVLVVMHYGVILREERYLEAKFGESYRRYRTAVRRYL